VSGDGLRLGILGRPATHSLSPAIHNAALIAMGIMGTYEAWDVDAEGARVRLGEIRTGRFDGCNVTMPYKRLAFDVVDERSDLATRTGAVNTVTRADRVLIGHNTDVAGITGAWARRKLPDEGPVLILGAGGAAAAAAVALSDREIVVSARCEDDANRLLDTTATAGRTVPWGTPIVGVVVNATPIGMNGECHDRGLVDSATGWFEMVYAHGETPGERQSRTDGKPVVSGTDMLVYQAIAAFELWTGKTPNIEVMLRALRAEERHRSDQQ